MACLRTPPVIIMRKYTDLFQIECIFFPEVARDAGRNR